MLQVNLGISMEHAYSALHLHLKVFSLIDYYF